MRRARRLYHGRTVVALGHQLLHEHTEAAFGLVPLVAAAVIAAPVVQGADLVSHARTGASAVSSCETPVQVQASMISWQVGQTLFAEVEIVRVMLCIRSSSQVLDSPGVRSLGLSPFTPQ